MLKKRILASSMASVMALSAVSVVAFADETVTAGATESVDKATLKEYIAGFESFLKTDVYEYGTIQADQIQNAVDYAENVIADANATDDDATAAYQMVKSVYDSLEKFDADDLKELMADVKDIYDSENILNEDLNDLIYPQDKFDDFVDAYEDADSYVNSGDGRLITDSYIALEKAAGDLEALPTVTKKDFRAVLKEFEAIATKLKDYETWRRGTVSVNPESGANWSSGDKKKLGDSLFVTYGDLINIVYNSSKVKVVKENKETGFTYVNSGTKTWIATGAYASVKAFVNAKYEEFDKIQTSTKTTDEDIALAYKAAKEAVEVFKSWKADDTTRAAKANINSLIDKYRAKLVRDYGTVANGIVSKIEAAHIAGLPAYTAGKTEWKTTDKITLVLDKDTHLISLTSTGAVRTTVANADLQYEQTVAKNQDIMKYIPVLTADVAAIAVNQEVYDIASAYANDLYTFRTDLAAYNAAKAAIPGSAPSGTGITNDTAITVDALANPEGGNVEASAVTKTPLKYDNTTSTENVAKVNAYNEAITAWKAAYDAVAASAEALTGSLAAAGAASPATLAAAKTAAETYVANKIAYDNAVADIVAFKALTQPTAGVVGTTGNSIWEDTTVAVAETKDIDGNVLLAAGNIKKYKAGLTASGEGSAAADHTLVDAWNKAADKAGTAAGVLNHATDAGGVAAYTAAIEAFDALDVGINTATDESYELVSILSIVDEYNAADKVVDDSDTEDDERAIAFANAYETGLDILDQNKTVEKPAGSRNEYTLINRKLTYVLDDMYPATKTDKYTKSDVKNLIEKAYDLCDKTGDSEVFSARHLALVTARKAALDWLTAANATKGYKEGDTVAGKTATKAYTDLKDVYDKLEKDYKAMPMSYGEIADLIATTAKAIDAGEYGASADAVKVALSAVAAGLSTLEASLDENYVFDYDREFVAFNRLLVGETADKKKPNDDEKELKKSIDTLNAAIEAAKAEPEKPEYILGDADGDGILSPADATKALELFLNDEYAESADMDGNGIINAADAYAILDAWLQA